MIPILAGAVLVMALVAFLFGARAGIRMSFFARPIVDASWNYGFAGRNFLEILGVAFPLAFFVATARVGKKISKLPYYRLWFIYILYNAFSYSVSFTGANPLAPVENFFRALNGFVAFFMLQAHFTDRDSLKRLLQFMIAASLFPLAVGLYQVATGVVWQERVTLGLQRNVGLYHDVTTLRFAVFGSLAAIFLYWSYFMEKGRQLIAKLFLAGLVAASFVVLFNTYSRGAYVIVGMWVLVWTLARGRIWMAAGAIAAIVLINILFQDRIWSETQQIFSREVAALSENASDTERARSLNSRWMLWEAYLDQFGQRPFHEILIGDGRGVPAHNDFLLKLMSGGFVGLGLYVLLLAVIGGAVLRRFWAARSPINVMAVILFLMWLIDSIGLQVSAYPGYQWYVWGFIGLAIGGVSLDRETDVAASTDQRSAVQAR